MLCVCVFFLRGTISDDVGSLVGEEGELCCSFVFLVTGVLNGALRSRTRRSFRRRSSRAERGDLLAKLESE
jgi:hypothetical protein